MAKDSSSGWSSALAGGADTIVAKATGAGHGALAVLRVSGPEAATIAGRVCPELDFQRPWRAGMVAFRGADGSLLEHGVAIPYRAPRSYTGEDMLEAMVHGSPYLVNAVIEEFVAAGARPAEPGEFTRRAVANGKMDLLQAEAVRDLIAAETAAQARLARSQLDGRLSAQMGQLRNDLVELLARLEASLDFEDQGVELETRDCSARWRRNQSRIAALLATAGAGERIRGGVRVVIVGAPNSGKSTLFNTLLGCERAIVDPRPGTTRDAIEAELEIAGARVILVDTAGLRESEDQLERQGMRRTRAAIQGAQVAIELQPADLPASQPLAIEGGHALVVRSKSDLAPGTRRADDGAGIPVSCVTGEGLAALRGRLRGMVRAEIGNVPDEAAIGSRHRDALERAAHHLEREDLAMPELAAERVRWALSELEQLTGSVATEEVLNEVFRTFCIGK
jgi:tRNA modification GTPase